MTISKRKVFVPSEPGEVLRTSVRVSKTMAADINTAVKDSGYNAKQRSTWAVGVIENFLAHPDAALLVAEEFFDTPKNGSTTLSLTLPRRLTESLNALLHEVEREYGNKKDRSAAIRAALLGRVSTLRQRA